MKNARQVVLEWGNIDADTGVSVAISLYNYARHIEECLSSVAQQDYPNIQLIVVDDCSQRDNSTAVAEAWMRAHCVHFASGILLRHEINYGLAEARNTAFEVATCNSVFVMDADNVIFPACIRKLKRAMTAANADAAYSQLVMFGDVSDVGLADYWSQTLLSNGPYIDAMAMVHRRMWRQVGGYTHLDGGWEDYDFWCKLVEQDAQVCYVPELLCKYRVHESSMLRTDTVGNYDRLFNLISLRHPWTRLGEP
ncbi:glycosyltransferase family A protein [Methylocella sp. CPCC 101449]|uniref:glycosyltransferase family 2 protein n=1 Tax=Methylocella sp. CPCC 101449 TaxID=2987531 RepID=UPI002890557F|nr:glycosyltransferase family A protein [Methylocella sp. CPCC 101449]MDT2019458.1 glycosyltransferase family 2 protein [Methylocella sp. CPCC 101449]